MTPDQFLKQLKRGAPSIALFLGPDGYYRDICRKAMLAAVFPDAPAEEREDGYVHHDLDELSLAEVLDDARSMSLFATRRLIWVSGAEGALPRGRAAAATAADDDDESPAAAKGGPALLKSYVDDPAPDTYLVFDCSRYDFDGEDKARIDRVQKYYGVIPAQVEFRPFTADAARTLAQDLAAKAGMSIGGAEVGMLVEALGADASRIAAEIEKLSLYAGPGQKVTSVDISKLVPNAQETTIFALVEAMGAGNRTKSLDLLDTLVREGEYLPLALSFLAGQFRLALVAREANLRTSSEIQNYFSRQGIRIWGNKAEQVRQTLSVFSRDKLEMALQKLFAADRGLRDARPDDRIVMEELILALTR